MKRRRCYPSMPTYLDRLVPVLLEVAAAVQDEGPDEVRRVITKARRMAAPAGVDQVEAVIVGLASLIDLSKTAEELFAKVDALVPAPVRPARVRPSRALFRHALVQAVVAGEQPYAELRGQERGAAVLAWQQAGWSEQEIMARTGQREATQVRRMAERASRAREGARAA